eukprot:9155393-Ditylum_brightwellii.AAC.2
MQIIKTLSPQFLDSPRPSHQFIHSSITCHGITKGIEWTGAVIWYFAFCRGYCSSCGGERGLESLLLGG